MPSLTSRFSPFTLATLCGTALGTFASSLYLQSAAVRNASPGSVQALGPMLTLEEKEILGHLSIVQLDDGEGGTAKTIRLTGANLQIVNGLGATNGSPGNPDATDPGATSINGVGNLIVGYNELGNPNGDNRTGSHNVVVGHGLNYATFGGLIAARDNGIGGAYACISGGTGNRGLGDFCSISGGRNGTASGTESSVHGGLAGTASGEQSTVLGGAACSATGPNATASGGNQNVASGTFASVSGGQQNEAAGFGSSVAGGEDNLTTGNYAAVTGGQLNEATGNHSAVSGGNNNLAEGFWSSVGGGRDNTAGPASENYVTVSGGSGRATLDTDDWVGGGLLEDQ